MQHDRYDEDILKQLKKTADNLEGIKKNLFANKDTLKKISMALDRHVPVKLDGKKCPRCGLIFNGINYCTKCGQRILNEEGVSNESR